MSLQSLTDDELETRLADLVGQERRLLMDLLRHLGEHDRRKLAQRRGFPSLWAYCTQTLGYSENEAWIRIQAARALRRFPAAEGPLASGKLSLTALARLFAVMTEDNHADLLARCEGLTTRQIERLLAEIAPSPDVRDCVRALSAETVHYGFTAGGVFNELVLRAKAVLWHKFPDGRLEDVLGQALQDLLERREPGPKRPAKGRGRSRSRYIPRWVRWEVWRRDGGRCSYEGKEGRRCGEEAGLEYDHVLPYAKGGASDDPDNIRLLCRAHNQLQGELDFGKRHS